MKIVPLTAILILLTSASAMAGPRQDKAKQAALEWGSCVITKAQEFAPQSEPAETLVTAAMGLCLDKGTNFKYLYRESTREYGLSFSTPASDEAIDRVYAQVEDAIHKSAIAAIIQARANK